MARAFFRATGLIRPVRALMGPLAGRLVFRASGNVGRPIEIAGNQMYLALPGRYPPMDMLAGRYEQETTKIFQRITKPGMSVMDVGAHVGYYSLIAAKQVGPEGKVYAFEPEPLNYDLLVKNAGLNGYHNIRPVRKALFNQVGVTTLYPSALDNGRHSIFQQSLPQSAGQTVETTTIDAFLEEEGWPVVGLVKIDVEGAELAVLEGMDRLLKENGELNMIIEFNPYLLQNAGVDLVQFLERPSRWGFEVNIIDENKGPLALDRTDLPSLINRLLAAESSMNLICTRQ